MKHTTLILAALLVWVQSVSTLGDGPTDNAALKVRPIPPPGGVVSEADRKNLEAYVAHLGTSIENVTISLSNKPALKALLPDVQIFHNAVRYALVHNEFFNPTNEVPLANTLIQTGLLRIQALQKGEAPWASSTGLVVRGYVSKIDGSVQPYGLVIPPSFGMGQQTSYRLDAWFHGRDEKLSEVNFLGGRLKSPGEFTPPNTFVLHLYGRYCNANKFAGEIDLLEALADVKARYSIDENRIAVRGFSMGGAACWQFATHYAGLWAAAAPGAGFSETADFLKVFQKETVNPPVYEQKLWHMYDATDYAVNLFNCPTVAYSGEIDSQKQAADIMAKALAAEGMELTHIIGPKTAHSYETAAKAEVNRRMDSIMAKGRNPVPNEVRFTTWTLRYNEMLWVKLNGLEHHWERARVRAVIENPQTVRMELTNVTSFTLSMPAGLCPLDNGTKPTVVINGSRIVASAVGTDRSWVAHFEKTGDAWSSVAQLQTSELAKRPGLQGPIDDAFMDSFLMVTPGQLPFNQESHNWVMAEHRHAVEQWRAQFRGEARVKPDFKITDEDIANHNLVLWGDPQSNTVLARIIDRLPIKWSEEKLEIAGFHFPTTSHIPALIYPNPLNPRRYVVLNSGFTFREYDYLNNARQVSKLPDFAIIDFTKPVTPRAPGGIPIAGFFNEKWQP